MLFKGAQKTCVLCCDCIEEIRLDRQFVVDLVQSDIIPGLTHEAIAVSLFRAAVRRETISRIFHPGQYDLAAAFDPNATVNLCASVLLRPEIVVQTRKSQSKFHNYKRSWAISPEQRQGILALLYEYGVGCATGECCGFVRDGLKTQERELIAV